MTKMIEAIYEDELLKPLAPIEGLKKHARVWLILCPRPEKKALWELAGTLTHEEAQEMRQVIDKEFEKIEGEW